MDIKSFQNKLLAAKCCAVDTMIFIYLFEENEKYLEKVNSIFQLVEENKLKMITSIISPIEILSAPALEKSSDKIKLYTDFFKLMKNLEVMDVSWQIVDESTKLRRIYGLRTPDAIQLATAKAFKASLFITNDRIFNKVHDFEIIQINN